MQEIRPFISSQDIICAEVPAPPISLVVFGASGDLTRRKLLGSLFQIFNRDLLSEQFYLLGAGRKKLSDEQFRQIAQLAIQEESGNISAKSIESFIVKQELETSTAGIDSRPFLWRWAATLPGIPE